MCVNQSWLNSVNLLFYKCLKCHLMKLGFENYWLKTIDWALAIKNHKWIINYLIKDKLKIHCNKNIQKLIQISYTDLPCKTFSVKWTAFT